jgi:hypothetical protein
VIRSGGTADDENRFGESDDSRDTDTSHSPKASSDEAILNSETSPESIPAQPSERRAEALSLVFGRLARQVPPAPVGNSSSIGFQR